MNGGKTMEKRYILTHNNIYFKQVEEKDFIDRYYKWLNDGINTKLLYRGTIPVSKIEVLKEYNELMEDNTVVIFSIFEKKTDIHFGFVGLYDIDWISRNAEHISFFDRTFWGKGYAKEMMDLSVGYGFDILNLKKIYAGVNKENIQSLKMCKRNGWIVEGTKREHHFKNNRYYDAVIVSILKREFEEMLEKRGTHWCIDEKN